MAKKWHTVLNVFSVFAITNCILMEVMAKRPIAVVVGMPKSGTSSINAFFRCHGYSVSHYVCKPSNNDFSVYCGLCFKNAFQMNLPLFNTCDGTADIYAQMDYLGGDNHSRECFVPQIEILDKIVEEAPNATLILNLRPSAHWLHSVKHWGDLQHRFMNCNITHFTEENWSTSTPTDEDFQLFYERHSARVRAFAARRPSLRLFELDIEWSDAETRLKTFFNISSNKTCWGVHNHNRHSKTKIKAQHSKRVAGIDKRV